MESMRGQGATFEEIAQALNDEGHVKPLTDRPNMRVIAEITKSKPGRPPDIRFWFEGVPGDSPMRTTEMIVWNQAVRQFLDSVKDESSRIKSNTT
jgi:hypothetical protein